MMRSQQSRCMFFVLSTDESEFFTDRSWRNAWLYSPKDENPVKVTIGFFEDDKFKFRVARCVSKRIRDIDRDSRLRAYPLLYGLKPDDFFRSYGCATPSSAKEWKICT